MKVSWSKPTAPSMRLSPNAGKNVLAKFCLPETWVETSFADLLSKYYSNINLTEVEFSSRFKISRTYRILCIHIYCYIRDILSARPQKHGELSPLSWKGPFCLRTIHLWNSQLSNKGQSEMEMKVWDAPHLITRNSEEDTFIFTEKIYFRNIAKKPLWSLGMKLISYSIICAIEVRIRANHNRY